MMRRMQDGPAGIAAKMSLATLLLALVPSVTAAEVKQAPIRLAAKTSAVRAKAAPASASSSAAQAIAILVNDEPITAFEIDQRERLLIMMSGAVSEYLQKNIQGRWERLVKSPGINEEFKAFAMKHNPQSQDDIKRLQKQFIEAKQRALRDELMREARSHAARGVRKQAQEELIEERLKLQEAKRLNVIAGDVEVNNVIGDIAKRNKMTLAQFGQHLAGQGGDIDVMRARIKATLSWNQVVRQRFGHRITVSRQDVDKIVSTTPAAGEDHVELQLQRIVLPAAALDQKAQVRRLADADKIRSAYKGCKSLAAAARRVPDAKLENLGARRPSSMSEPTRSLLLNAKDGDLLPPAVGSDGVEIYAVCGRTVVKASEEKRSAAQDQLRQREFELLAQRHLKDLRQDASIEYR